MPGLDEATNAAKTLHLEDEPLTVEAAAMAGRLCGRHCQACDGELHHWIDECSDEGEPIQVCKHCPAWRAYPDDSTEQDEG